MKSARKTQRKVYRDGPKVRKPQLKSRYVKKELRELTLDNYPLEYEEIDPKTPIENDSLFTA